MQPKRIVLALLFLLFPWLVSAQDENPTFLSLNSDTLDLETGEIYTFRIDIENVTELWGTDLTLRYDPSQIYIIGTESGSPITQGSFFGDNTLFTLANSATPQDGTLRYAVSLLNPADPITGSGTLGTFQVVPLVSGTAQLTFMDAQLAKINFRINDEGQRIGENAETLPFTPILLQVNITGDPATPPPEVTATPTATPTNDPALTGEEVTEEPTPTELVNITAVPRTPTPEATAEVTPEAQPDETVDGSNSVVLLIAVGLIVVSLIGIVLLFVVYRRRS